MPVYRVYGRDLRAGEDAVDFEMECVKCTCSPTESDKKCNGDWAMLDYASLCRRLIFNPTLPVFLASSHLSAPQLPVVYPWEPHPYTYTACDGADAPPVKPESAYGKKCDYETKENPFGWVDHAKPVLCFPVHKCNPSRIALVQPFKVSKRHMAIRKEMGKMMKKIKKLKKVLK